MSASSVVPPTVRYGHMTDREHALADAHAWQERYLREREGETLMDDAYTVIVRLLGCFNYDELQRAIRKAKS